MDADNTGKRKRVAEEEKEKEEEEREETTRNSSSIGTIINSDQGGQNQGEEENVSSDKSALANKNADDASKKKRKIMIPPGFFCGQTQKSSKTSDAGVRIGGPFSCLGGASNPKGNSDQGLKEGEEKESSEKNALDMTSMEAALPIKNADDANIKKRKIPHIFYCGQKSLKTSDAGERIGGPFSCLGGARNPKGNTENPASSATQPQHPRENLTRFTIGRFLLTGLGWASNPKGNSENPGSSASPTLHRAPLHPPVPVSSSLSHESASSPRGSSAYTTERFTVTDSDGAADADESDRNNSSTTSNKGVDRSPREPEN